MPRLKKNAKKTSLTLYRKKGWKRSSIDSPNKISKRFCCRVTPRKSIKRNKSFTPQSKVKRRVFSMISPIIHASGSTSYTACQHAHVSLTSDSGALKNKIIGDDSSDDELFKSDTLIITPVKYERKADKENINSSTKSRKKLKFAVGINSSKETTSENHEVSEVITMLQDLVNDGNFSTENISFKLFLDSLTWYSSENTSGMRYSNATKEFFWTGQRLLGGQFLRFMRGFAHQGLVTEGRAEKGMYDPTKTEINLPVPSNRTLAEYTPTGFCFEDDLKPGILKKNIDLSASAMTQVSHVVMFDGKKITPNSADIFLLGKEEEPKLAALEEVNKKKVECIEQCLKNVELLVDQGLQTGKDIDQSAAMSLIEESKNVIKVIGTVTRSLRECYSKKALYLENLQKKILESNEEKLKFACNRIKTLMYKIKVCVNDLVEVVNVLCQLCAEINGSLLHFRKEVCDLTQQGNYRELKPPGELKCHLRMTVVPENLVKQRSSEWFDIRKTVRVTGSVAHRALGLDTLAGQKEHFESVFGNSERQEPTEQQKRAMEHGSSNEINAVATLVAKVLPVYYPKYCFYEEGAYSIKNDKDERVMIISPDGSMKENNSVVSVEIKCPFSSYTGMTPVYYNVKPRHIIQCYLEADVLKATEHIYLSWSKETTTVFRMKPNPELTRSVVEEVQKKYYGDYPVVPTKLSDTAKILKQQVKDEAEKAEFLGEFPSVMAHQSVRSNSAGLTSDSYYVQDPNDTQYQNQPVSLEKVVQYLHKGIKAVSEAFQYQKPMASEVLVYLMSDMDRSWNREIGHGLPITYLFKGYSLSMATSRRILDEVLNECYESGAHVPCVCFDGQFARLKDFDEQETPLTLFALQRRFWTEVQKLTKRQLIEKICEIFSNPRCCTCQEAHVDDEGTLVTDRQYSVVENKNEIILPIQTSISSLRKGTGGKVEVQRETSGEYDIVDSAGLEEEVVDIIQEVTNSGNDSASPVSPELCPDEEDELNYEQVNQIRSDGKTMATKHSASESTSSEVSIFLDERDYQIIQRTLQDTKRSKWKVVGANGIAEIFSSADNMNKEFTGEELKHVVKYLNLKLKSQNFTIHQNLRKSEKINAISKVIGNKTNIVVPPKRTRPKSVKSLKALYIMELQKRTYSKEALAVSYARSSWPVYKDIWFETATVEEEIYLKFYDNLGNEVDHETFTPVYAPEYSKMRKQLELRVMDGTHMRTNIKSKLIRHGIGKIGLAAWKKVAVTGETDLVPAMLELQHDGKIMHQQSDPYVRTMFSEAVQEVMTKNGDLTEAEFCRLFRRWHEAEDMAGLSALQRCQRSIDFRKWLLHGYNFGHFPPPSQYVRGIPRVTFEGLVCSIDAHILLYAMVKGCTYNWRTVSTLVAENFMGELAERSQNNHGVPSGKSLPMEMRKISELHGMRLKPVRSFQMKTSKSRAYEVPKDVIAKEQPSVDVTLPISSGPETLPNYCEEAGAVPRIPHISVVNIRNHEFDERIGSKGKHGRISNWNEQPKGVQPVRYHYKVDETKILPSLRLGISEKTLSDILD